MCKWASPLERTKDMAASLELGEGGNPQGSWCRPRSLARAASRTSSRRTRMPVAVYHLQSLFVLKAIDSVWGHIVQITNHLDMVGLVRTSFNEQNQRLTDLNKHSDM